MTSWSAWNSVLDEELTYGFMSLWVMVKGRAGKGDIVEGVCYRPPDQED